MSTASVQIAKDRLKALLGADRMQCTPDITEKLSADLYHILSKYMEISREPVSYTHLDVYKRQE